MMISSKMSGFTRICRLCRYVGNKGELLSSFGAYRQSQLFLSRLYQFQLWCHQDLRMLIYRRALPIFPVTSPLLCSHCLDAIMKRTKTNIAIKTYSYLLLYHHSKNKLMKICGRREQRGAAVGLLRLKNGIWTICENKVGKVIFV